jgi:MFS transporter, DHA3 family, macrolide efflux protein
LGEGLPDAEADPSLEGADEPRGILQSPRFLAVWSTQTLSMVGGGLTSFALGVWVFEETGSATMFALLTVATTLPGILVLPFAGVLTDRLGPRRTLLLATAGGSTVAAVLIGIHATVGLQPIHLYPVLAVGAVVASVQWPGYTAATTALLPRAALARGAAFMNLGYAGQHVFAPVLGAVFLAWAGVSGVLAIDGATFLLAGLVVVIVAFPGRGRTEMVPGTVREGLSEAWAFIRSAQLVRLSVYVGATYLAGGFMFALSTPMLLTVTSPEALGLVMSVMGVGGIVGNVVAGMTTRAGGGVRRLLRWDLGLAVSMLLVGLHPSPWLVGAAGFLFLFSLSGHMAEEQAVWQVLVPLPLQGRALALRKMITWGALTLSFGIAGPLADYVFEPWMQAGGALAGSVGSVLGTGAGRGMALLLMCGGLYKLGVIAWTARDRGIRSLDAGPEGG